ncbi:MAG: preprotein translocase subunit SecE [Lachnospiraceae bacterium]|nr:preprotein translocase subunit SecE [Lachnospiraceae bacterium]
MEKIKSFWSGLKAEFHKCIWPDKTSTAKQTVVVTVITIILGIIIALIDTAVQYGVNFITQ